MSDFNSELKDSTVKSGENAYANSDETRIQIPEKWQTRQVTQLTQQGQNNKHNTDMSTQSSSKESADKWELSNPRKTKRNSPQHNIRNTKQKTLTGYIQINQVNRFQALVNNNTESEEDEPEIKIKPPPIFIPDVLEIQPLIKIINEVAKDGFTFKIIGKNQVKVNPKESTDYTKIIRVLNDKNTSFHTYQLKEERSFRVVIKNIHHTTDLQELKTEIEEKGHKVLNIYNNKKRGTQEPLPMFFVDLQQSDNNKDIYDIKYLQYTKVLIEPPRQKREIPQCARCQRYGHTKKYCTRQQRCVKCGDNHWTSTCVKEKGTKAKCVLCKGDHPANYKGCQVFKEIQSRKFPPLRSRSQPAPRSDPGPTLPKVTNPNESYANMVRNNNEQNNTTNTHTNQTVTQVNLRLEGMMIKLLERMDTMLNLLTTLVAKMK